MAPIERKRRSSINLNAETHIYTRNNKHSKFLYRNRTDQDELWTVDPRSPKFEESDYHQRSDWNRQEASSALTKESRFNRIKLNSFKFQEKDKKSINAVKLNDNSYNMHTDHSCALLHNLAQ